MLAKFQVSMYMIQRLRIGINSQASTDLDILVSWQKRIYMFMEALLKRIQQFQQKACWRLTQRNVSQTIQVFSKELQFNQVEILSLMAPKGVEKIQQMMEAIKNIRIWKLKRKPQKDKYKLVTEILDYVVKLWLPIIMTKMI